MIKKTPKCKKGFPCGKACISRNNNCYANLSTENTRIVESFSQFVNRLVGIGNDKESVINPNVDANINTNPTELSTLIQVETTKVDIIENKIIPQVSNGSTLSEIKDKLNTEITAGNQVSNLLKELKPIEEILKEVSVEVLPNDVTNIPRLLSPETNLTIDITAETINTEIKAGTKVKRILEKLEAPLEAGKEVTKILEALEPQIVAGKDVTELLNGLEPPIEAGPKVKEVLENLKAPIVAGREVTEVLNALKQEIVAGKEVTKVLEALKPLIVAGKEVTELLENLKAPVEAGKEVTKVLEALEAPIVAGKDVTEILNKLEPPVEAGPGVKEVLENLKAPIVAGKEVTKVLEELKPKVEALEEAVNPSKELDTNTTTTKKYVKSYSELTKDELKKVKAAKNDVNAIYEVILTDDGKLEKEAIDKEEKELDILNAAENEAYAKLYQKVYYQDKFVQGVNLSLPDYDSVLTPFSGSKLVDLIEQKVKPLRGLLEENAQLAKEYARIQSSNNNVDVIRKKELKNQFDKNNDDIKKLLEIDNDYEDETYNDISLHDAVFKIAFKDYPRGFKNQEKVYDQSIWDLADEIRKDKSDVEDIIRLAKNSGLDENSPEVQQRLKNRSNNVDNWLNIDISDEDAAKLDNKRAEIAEEFDKIFDPDVKRRNQELKIRKEEFNRNLDRQVSGNTETDEDKKRYNRNGSISPNIENRNLPIGDSNNPEEAKLQEIIDERVPMMAIPVANLKAMLDGDGEFKNVYDFDNTKKGIAGKLTKQEYEEYKKARIKKENEAFGVPVDATPSQRPVYGFLGNQDDLAFQLNYDGIQAYGGIVVQFKPEVKDDATVTIDDSLGGPTPNQKGSPANKVSKESMPNRQRAKVNLDAKDHRDIIDDESQGVYREPRYIEWQGGSRLSLKNVEKIHIPLNVLNSLPTKVLNQLKEYGIEIVVLAPRVQ